jgi:outer membrane receptor protein involved in Fe transport
MKIKHLLFFFLLFISCISFSQKMRITGFVQDTTENKPLQNALAMIVRIKDSVLVDFRRTDINGNFSFLNLAIDTVQLVVSHPRFSENSYYLFGSESNKDFDIKKITLPLKSQLLKEVVIYAYKDPVFYKGDTLVYVADSFATKPNAVVEDLLKKLPGIKVNADGSIQAQGKDIQQVLVDGDEFFGADPTMATKNLAASGVETVQIYEKKDENASEDSETIQVLDLKLKDEAKKGYFGKISGASDVGLTPIYKPFYEGEMLFNKFNKKRKISVFSLASNTMKSSLDWKDMYKYGLETREFNYEDEDSWMWEFSNNQGNGIPRTFKSGVYVNENITKKTELNVNYTYNNSELSTLNTNRSEYFLSDTSYISDLTESKMDRIQSHEINLKLIHKIDSSSTFEFEPKVKLNNSKTDANDKTDFLSENFNLTRNTNVENLNDANGNNLSSRISYRKDFKKKGRKFTVNYRFVLDKNDSDGILKIVDTDSTSNSSTNQSKENASLSKSHTSTFSFIEPLNPKFKLEMDYEFYNNFNDQSKFARNFNGEDYLDIDSTFSNSFETRKNQHRIGTQLIFEQKKHKLSFGLRVRNVVIENNNIFFNTQINQNITNYLPRAKYVYKISQNNRFTINYTTSSAHPTINQLQPVLDNTNPNRVQIGNTNLKPTFNHNLTLNYSFYKPLSGTHFWLYLNSKLTDNAFANSSIYDTYGRSISQTINVDGNKDISLNMGGGFPIFNKFIEIFPNLSYSYSNLKGFVDNIENLTVNQKISGGFDAIIERDSVEFSIGVDLTYNMPSSTISSESVLPYMSQRFGSNFLWKIPLGFLFETDANYTINSNRAEGYDLNFIIWNASLSKSFLKNQNLLFAVEINDILNQNISAKRTVNSNVITDTKSVIISRYVMFRLTYKFNNNKTKESDDFF